MKITMISTIDGKSDEGMKNVATGICSGLTANFLNLQINKIKPQRILLPKNLIAVRKSDYIFVCLRANAKVYRLCSFIRTFNKKIVFIYCQPPTDTFVSLRDKRHIFFKEISLFVDEPFFNHCLKIQYPVDSNKFVPANAFPLTKSIISVGHLTEGRNVIDFTFISNECKKTFITSIDNDIKIRDALLKNGVTIINHYLPNLEQYYQMNDIYLFPTIDLNSVIFIPLSVLEAASCGLPVVMRKDFPCLSLVKEYVSENGIFLYSGCDDINIAIEQAYNFVKEGNKSNLLIKSSWKEETSKILRFLEGETK